MSDLHRISLHTLHRAAHGGRGKSVDVGRQASPGPVTVMAELHVEITRETELDGQRWLEAIESALVDRGASVFMGPVRVKPAEMRRSQ